MAERAAEVSLRSYGERETTHAHDWHQLVLPIEGAHAIGIGETEGTVEARQGALIASRVVHRYRAIGTNRFVVLDIPRRTGRTDSLPDGVWRRALASPFFPIDEGLARFAHYLAHEMADRPLDAATSHHATALLMRAMARALDPAPLPLAIARAIERMHARYAEPLTVGDLARHAGLSVSAFHGCFRSTMGQSPADYLVELRLDHAVRLLEGSALSIAEIAFATGFSEQSALTRSFRRRRGTTPGRIRRGHA